MKKGGYKIIDFKGAALSGTAVEIPGIFNQIVYNYNKPIMVSGVIISGELQDDAYAAVSDTEDTVVLTVYDGVITVTEDDEITFASAMSNTELTEDVSVLNSTAIMKTSTTTINADANEAVNGWVYYGGSSTNLPSSSAYFVLTLIHDTYKCQLAISRAGNILFTRTYTFDAWTEWKQATNV